MRDDEPPICTMGVAGLDLALDVRGLTKHYEDFALHDVTFAVPAGSIVGLVGRNGAGKTTAMRCILGTTTPDGGSVRLFGRDVTAMGERARARARERVASVVSVCPYPNFMSIAQVATTWWCAYPRFDHRAFEALLDRMDIMHQPAGVHRPVSATRHVGDLSRGQGMKLQLAACLASGADLLVLDEPTAGLDPVVRDEVLSIVREHMVANPECSVLVSSHITSDLERLADYVVMVDGGRVVLSAERDLIDDVMGIARLRAAELERVVAEALPGNDGMRVIDGLGAAPAELLVPDRAAFVRAHPGMVCDKATIDDVMRLVAKGRRLS